LSGNPTYQELAATQSKWKAIWTGTLAPEAYLAAYGVVWDLPPSSENESPVDFPHPGLKAPEVLLSVQPYYSDANRKAHIEGTVTIECVIGTDGLVHAVVIQKGLTEELDKLALNAMTLWRLQPVSDGSRAVAARVPVQIAFHLL
jgi:TonB family protein